MGVTKTNNHPNQDQDCKPQSGTSRILQNPKSEVKGQVCLLHLQNQDRDPKLGILGYQRSVNIFKSKSRCHTPVRTWMLFEPLKGRE